MKKAFAAIFAVLTPGLYVANAMAADLPRHREPYPQAYEETDESGGVKLGYLSCDIAGGLGYVLGSAKQLDCVFQSTRGARHTEAYSGTIRKMGVDLGFTAGGRLVWAVVAPTSGYHRGALGGLYQGATLEATLGLGVGANVLIGGTSGAIQLQTVSVTGQVGLNLAATGTSVTLTPVSL